jgi:protein gp37
MAEVGESGPKFRPMSREWKREATDQCRDTGVILFFKKLPGVAAFYADRKRMRRFLCCII